MMSLSILDWVIVLIVVLSVLQAIGQGFFYEFFCPGGSDRRISAGGLGISACSSLVCARFVNSPWTAEIAGFFTIFVVVMVLAGMPWAGSRAGWCAGWGCAGSIVCWERLRLPSRGVIVSAVMVLALAAFAPQWGLAAVADRAIHAGCRAAAWFGQRRRICGSVSGTAGTCCARYRNIFRRSMAKTAAAMT